MTRRLAMTTAAAILATGTLAGTALADDARLVTVLTSEHPQTQLMAMVLSNQAVDQGQSLHMLLCGPAGDIALREAPESATAAQPPQGASPQGMLTGLIAAGATVEVCAIYLPGIDAGPEALIDGVGVAQPPAMAGAMLAEGVRVWSF